MNISEITGYLDSSGIEYSFKGDVNESITGFSSIKDYHEGTMTWVRDTQTFEKRMNWSVWR